MNEEMEIQLSEHDAGQAVEDKQLPDKDASQAVEGKSLSDKDADHAIKEKQVFPSFANGPTDSAQVLDIPEPVRNGHKTVDSEFIVGAAVLSSVGGVFLLIALALVWVNYMDGFLKGMSMYLISGVFLCVSELLIRKVWLKLSYVLTSVGISGFYVSTMVNCQSFNHFPVTVGLIIIAMFSVFVLLYGWARNIPWYRILSLLVFYFCLTLGRVKLGDEMYFLTIAFGLAVGLLNALLPLKRQILALTVISMLAMVLLFDKPIGIDWLGMVQELIYCMGAMLVLTLLLYRPLKISNAASHQKFDAGSSQDVDRTLCFVVYLVSLFFLYLWFIGAALSRNIFSPALQFCMIGTGSICLVSFAILWKYREKWLIYLWFNILACTVYLTMELRDGEGIGWGGWCLAVLLLISELLSLHRRPTRLLSVCRAVLTATACITVISVSGKVYVYVLLAILLAGIFLVNHWHTYYELAATYTLAWFVIKDLPIMLSLPVFVGVLFVGILLVNNIKRLRGSKPLIYNWGILVGQIMAYLFLLMPICRNFYLMYFCMLIFGLSIIVLILQEKYQLNCECKLFVAELFLAYLALTIHLNPSVIASILLMAVALAGVIGGFRLNQKSARICGLLFSLLACGKIVLYDFRGGPTIQRILLFLVAGVIAMIIGGIYIILEKKMREKRISQLTGGGG